MKDGKEFHKAEEFNKFPWYKLINGEHKCSGENFSFGKGGDHFVNGRGWNITVYSEDDLSCENWELPKALSDMLDWQEKKEKKKIKDIYKTLLEIY